jgi:hypothetical protein
MGFFGFKKTPALKKTLSRKNTGALDYLINTCALEVVQVSTIEELPIF